MCKQRREREIKHSLEGALVFKTHLMDLKPFKNTCYGLSCKKLFIHKTGPERQRGDTMECLYVQY